MHELSTVTLNPSIPVAVTRQKANKAEKAGDKHSAMKRSAPSASQGGSVSKIHDAMQAETTKPDQHNIH